MIAQASGLFASGFGLFVFFYGESILPPTPTRFIEPLSFGSAFLGQALLYLWLSMRVPPRA